MNVGWGLKAVVRKHTDWLLILVALILTSAMVSGTSFANLDYPDKSDKKALKKEEKEKKAEKKKSESDDDDDVDDDDDEKEQDDEKKEAKLAKEEKSAKEIKKSSSKSETKSIKNSAPSVELKISPIEVGSATEEKPADEEKRSGSKSAEAGGVSEEKPAKEVKKSSTKSETRSIKNSLPSKASTADSLETVNATVETDPVPHSGDAADDPAIWINKSDPAKSVIIGSDKQGGVAVYDLSGKQLQYLPDGQIDNVDIRDGFKLNGQDVSIVTGGNRKDNSMVVYKMNPETRTLENVAARKLTHGIQIYGSCMYRSEKTAKVYYFGTSKSGDVEQWELFDNGSGKVDGKKVRNFKVGTTVEGCVTDDELGHFYVGEEAVGIWKYSAEPDGGSTRVQVGKVGDGNLFADVEGLAIAYDKDGKGYLMASSQGNHSYVVYRREGSNEFVKKFRIGDGDIDGAEETDGIDVTTAKLGPAFPHGLFVVQDGFNDKGNQNFKLVPLETIIKR
jgi:3-phytase